MGRLLNLENKTSQKLDNRAVNIRQFILLLVVSIASFFAGWVVRGPGQPEAPLVQLTEMIEPTESIVRDAVEVAPPEPFPRAIKEVRALISEQRFATAYAELLDAYGLATEANYEAEFVQTLGFLVDAYSRQLIELRQTERIDELYEQLTFDYPQYAIYQFRLGKIRVQMGNLQEALLPLAQVANHPQFGAEARKLMGQIEGSSTNLAFAELPLSGRDGQFIVEAQIDGGLRVNLLVDTGAAITAIDRGVLQQAGYDMNVEQQYFATANGVVAAPVLTVNELRLGEATVGNLSVGALSLNMSGDVVGLLGMNFLRHYDFRIDQTRRVLILDRR